MSGPPPVIARARTAMRVALTARLAALADRTDPQGLAPRVLVAVSGGADSLALMATAAWVGSRMGLQAEAAIIDHGLQPGSAEVAQRAAVACERLGATAVQVRRVHVDTRRPGGVENTARDARHGALEQIREDRSALALLLGHTLDDQAEQVLMALARGAGARALAGMPAASGPLLRPFLGSGRDETTALRRIDTETICRLHDVDWWEDPMNEDTSLLRVRVRREVLPLLREALGEQIDANLARTAELMRPDVELLDARAAAVHEALSRTVDDSAGDLLALDVHALAVEPAAIRTRVLRDAARQAEALGGWPSDKSLLRRQVLACDALVVSWHGQGPIPLPGRIEVARREGLLVWRLAREDRRRS